MGPSDDAPMSQHDINLDWLNCLYFQDYGDQLSDTPTSLQGTNLDWLNCLYLQDYGVQLYHADPCEAGT